MISVRVASIGAVAFALSSCELPPRDAWRSIQSQGLLTYYMDRDRNPVSAPTSNQKVASSVITQQPKVTPPSTPPPSQLPTRSMPVAKSVPDLPGYVRTPFTNPPRLVDVRGMTAGSTVVCPYTQKPFLVPSGANRTSSANVASNSSQRSSLTIPTRTPQSSASTQTTASTTKPKPKPSTTPAPTKKTTPNVASTPTLDAPAPSIPFGKSITGRPGFVNSPFAATHQLVDVTGLPVGMEVKCPYTGKLFKVPPQATAQSNAAE
jgi:hypothetical protein